MRVLDRLTAVAVALAFVLAALGAPAHAETLEPGAAATAVQRSIVHDGHAPAELRTEFSGGPRGDHVAGVASGDGPDDLLLVAPPRVAGAAGWAVAAVHYRPPAVPSPSLTR
ncbi:hypothetical protein, partial [Micromonospora sp. AMSO31t]|uniref:hypothetical protein n=1 Tax=Micromonospora sp. AMSO31t TaxID=2650566 RepID=UPI00124B2F68